MYIRTKDGRILDFEKLNEVSKLSIDMAEEPIQESENLYDLCDGFRYEYDEHSKHEVCYSTGRPRGIWYDYDTDMALTEKEIATIRGGIWTDEGFIYRTKMNDKGELELICTN